MRFKQKQTNLTARFIFMMAEDVEKEKAYYELQNKR